MRLGKRFLALILAISLVLSCGISSVLAADNGSLEISEFQYLEDGITLGSSTSAPNIKAEYKDSGNTPAADVTAAAQITYGSSEPAVGSVGADGIVTGHKTGTVTITATAAYKGKTVTKTAEMTIYAANKESLDIAILDAEIVLSSTIISVDGSTVPNIDQWVTPQTAETLQLLINKANIVSQNNDAIQSEVDAVEAELVEGVEAFIVALKFGEMEVNEPDVNIIYYTNSLGYVSIDKNDALPASDYFLLQLNDSAFSDVEILGCSIARKFPAEVRTALELQVSELSHGNGIGAVWGYPIRFILKSGKTLADGVYEIPVRLDFRVGEMAGSTVVSVELHVNSTDPAYFKSGEAVFEVADLDNPGPVLTSSTVTIKVPSGNKITDLVAAEKKYEVVDGKWDESNKEYTFKLRVKADSNGEYNFIYMTGVLATFENKSQQRMAYTPAEVPLIVSTSDTKPKKYGNISSGIYDLEVGSASKLYYIRNSTPLPEGATILDNNMFDVRDVSNFVSSPAGAIFFNAEGMIEARAEGTATFDTVINIGVSNLYKVSCDYMRWKCTNNTIHSVLPKPKPTECSLEVETLGSVSINDPSTYEIPMRVTAYDKNHTPLAISSLSLDAADADDYAISDLKKNKESYTFTLTLKNKKRMFSGIYLILTALTPDGKVSSFFDVPWHMGSKPTRIYFTKDGKEISKDALVVGAEGTKYNIVIDGHQVTESDQLVFKIYGQGYKGAEATEKDVTIVRGQKFYGGSGTSETITIRMERSPWQNTPIVVEADFTCFPKIENKDVLLQIEKGTTCLVPYESRGRLLLSDANGSVFVDKTTLQSALSTANERKNAVSVSVDGKNVPTTKRWVTQEVMNSFNKAVADAKAVYDKSNATDEDIANAVDSLEKAQAIFEAAQKSGMEEPGTPEEPGKPEEPSKPGQPSIPNIPSKPGSSGSSGSSGGSGSTSSYSSAGNTANEKSSSNVTASGEVEGAAVAKQAADNLQQMRNTTPANSKPVTDILVENAQVISPAALKQVADAAQKAGGSATIHADTTYNGKTIARITFDVAKAAALNQEIKLSVATDTAAVQPVLDRFKKYFENQMTAASFAQTGSFGMEVHVAVKVDLTGIDLNKLVIYSFDRATNSFVKMNSGKVFVDINGFLHFSTTRGGDMLFSNGPLTN